MTLAVSVALLASVSAHAQEQEPDRVSIGVRVGATHSDNIERLPVDELSDTTGELGLIADVTRTRGRLNVGLASDLRYQKYFNDTFGDELIGGLNGTLSYWFLPERFRWTVQDNFAQTFIDPTAVETPDNRQNINYFSTGPDLRLPLGSRTTLELQARWSQARYETSDSDDERLMGSIGVVRQLGAHSALSINARNETVEFRESTLDDGYDRRSAYLGFNAVGARTRLSAVGGVTALRSFVQTNDAPMFDLLVARELTTRSVLTLNVGTNLTDSAEMLRRGQTVGGVQPGNENIIASLDPFQSDYARLAWTFTGARTALALGADYREEDHEVTDELNRTTRAGNLRVTRRMSSVLALNVGGEWRREELDQSAITFDEWSAGLGVDWTLSADASLLFRGDHFKGTGDTFAGGGTRNYTENRFSVAIQYTPHW